MLEVVALAWGFTGDILPVAAAPSGPSFVLAYEPAPSCPTRATFEAAILARAPRGKLVEDATQADVQVQAEFSPDAPRKGQLRVALRDGTNQDREIEADDCAEAVQSMAVIVGMILDAQPLPSPVGEEPPRAQSVARPVRSETTPVIPARAAPPPEQKPMRGPSTRLVWRGLGLGAGLESSAAPTLMPAVLAFGEVGALKGKARLGSLRFELLLGQAPDVVTVAGDARFRLALGRVYSCGGGFGGERADLRFCLVVEGGGLFARGMGKALNQRSQGMPWFGGGLGVLGGLRLGQRWTLEAHAAGRALAVHDEFIFAPAVPVHQVPGFALNFGLGLRFGDW